ncbi:MAG: septum formation initiator family protein [Chloroflexi bacterium]|nr:septum formation initiator family protein [Chloroflexota bacterium]
MLRGQLDSVRGSRSAALAGPILGRLVLLLLLPLVMYGLYATGQKAMDNFRLNQQADGLSDEVVALRAENLKLQADLEYARTDAAIEAIAREQLGLVRPGDRALATVGSGAVTPPPPPAPNAPPAPPPWQQWRDLFFGPPPAER